LLSIPAFWWVDDYFEYQDDCEKCIGMFMNAVSAQYNLDRAHWIFGFCNFAKWASPKTLAVILDEALQSRKQQAKSEE